MPKKVSSDTRQVVPEGETAEDLPEPRGLQGVSRRPMPIGSLTTKMRRLMTAQFRELQERVMRELESSGALQIMADDAGIEGKAIPRAAVVDRAGPVGRGGMPLGPASRREAARLFNRPGMEFTSKVMDGVFEDWTLTVEGRLTSAYRPMYEAGGRGAARKLGVRSVFDLRNPLILDSLKNRANLLTGSLAEDIFGRLKTVMADQFYIAGQSPLEVAGTLRSEFSFLKKTRAELIARTETLAITSEAQHTVYMASGVKKKRWLTTLDGNERETHFEAHGQMVQIDAPFQVGDSELQFPGDPAGDISELANCRCDMIPVVMEDQQFEGATVWNGSNAPDQFARERLQRAA